MKPPAPLDHRITALGTSLRGEFESLSVSERDSPWSHGQVSETREQVCMPRATVSFLPHSTQLYYLILSPTMEDFRPHTP